MSLAEILVAALLIGIALVPLLQLYPGTLGFNLESDFDMRLSAAAVRKMEENITILRVPPVVFDASARARATAASSSVTMIIGSSANYFVILIGIQSTTIQVSSVTVGGTAATLLLARNHAGGSHRSELWRLQNPPTGSVSVAVTLTGSVSHGFVAASFRNVLAATPLGSSAGSDGSSLTPSVTITPRTAASMMVGGFVIAGSGLTITQGGGQAVIDTRTTGGGTSTTHLAQEINQGDTGTVMDWTSSATGNWVALAAELRGTVPVGAASGTATCTDVPNCLLVWTIATELSSTVRAVEQLRTLNVTACQDTNGNSACDSGERQVRYDAKITSHP